MLNFLPKIAVRLINPWTWVKFAASLVFVLVFLSISVGVGDYFGARGNVYYEDYRRLSINLVNFSLAKMMPFANKVSEKIEKKTPVYTPKHVRVNEPKPKGAILNFKDWINSLTGTSWALFKLTLIIIPLVLVSPYIYKLLKWHFSRV